MDNSEQVIPGETRPFRYALYFICGVQVLLAGGLIWQGNLFFAMWLLIQTLGLYRRLRWGRRMFACFLWYLVMVGVALMMPVRFENVDLHGAQPPSVLVAAMQSFAVCAGALTILHFIGKWKSYFRPKWF